MTDTVIESLKTYFLTYGALDPNAPFTVDFLGSAAEGYAILSMPGARILSNYIGGKGKLREYPFAFLTSESTAAELDRIDNLGFTEALTKWLETQDDNEVYPVMPNNMVPFKLEALSGGYLYETSESQTGRYQVLCKLTYEDFS